MCGYCRKNGRGGWMRPAGIALILLGALILTLIVPPKVWAAMLSALLIAAGTVLLKAG